MFVYRIFLPRRRGGATRSNCLSAAPLRRCGSNLSMVLSLEKLVGAVDGEEFVGGAVDV
jgi:hypothetical protein